MPDDIFIPTFNGTLGLLLPKQRKIVLTEITRPRFHRYPNFIAGIAYWSEARERANRWLDLRNRLTPRNRQRGSIGIFTGGLIIEEAGGAITPAFSDIQIINTVSSGLCNAAIEFNYTTGGFGNHQLVKQHNAVHSLMGDDDDTGGPVDHTGEWTASAVTGADWEVACTVETIGTWDFPFAAVGVFSDFTNADMGWRENRTGGKGYTPGTDRCAGTFFIREVADTGNSDNQIIDVSAIQT